MQCRISVIVCKTSSLSQLRHGSQARAFFMPECHGSLLRAPENIRKPLVVANSFLLTCWRNCGTGIAFWGWWINEGKNSLIKLVTHSPIKTHTRFSYNQQFFYVNLRSSIWFGGIGTVWGQKVEKQNRWKLCNFIAHI